MKESDLAIEALGWILNDIKDNAKEASKRFEDTPTEYNSGYDQAYYEVLDMIKNRLDILNVKIS